MIKKILICTGIFPPDAGGPATYSKFLLDELPKRDFKVGVITYGPAGISRRIPKGIRHLFYFLVCWLRAWGYDCLFAQDTVSAGLPAMLAAKLSGKKFVIRVAGDYAWEQAYQRFGVDDSIDDFQSRKYDRRTEILRRIQKFVVRQADLIITPSVYFKNLVSAWVPKSKKVIAIYNGIKLQEALERDTKRAFEDKKIISVGRLVPWKGFGALFEIMPKLPGWQLIIIGDGPERAALESKITQLGLSGRVSMSGLIPRSRVLEYLKDAAIFVLNTSFESFSFDVVQAMNAGVPVITTWVCNLPEIIEDGKEGFLVEPNNIEQIVSAIKKLAADQNLYDEISRNAKTKVKEFSIEKTLDNIEKVLNGL